MKTKQRQLKFVLDHLESGETLTSVKAQCIYSIHRLASRISDLRKAGHNIESIPIGGGFVKYRLDTNAPYEKEFFEFLKGEGVLDEYIDLNTESKMSQRVKGVFSLPIKPKTYIASAFEWPLSNYREWLSISAKWISTLRKLETLKSNV